ncbi:DUF2961 domain-containing protein [Paludisphaera borealis]|uniref:DUF2961 domain-containing protein n=1 Tax=Paludisphaera borealis TaxID=1387353 RepID=A0A1U7CM78_9BACT|nr:DUF2961 domain-containing protein [Paludisphaera borealis]APW60054.1 hypothetical protein BSF38_01516 [Paludisphaera borealis]
MNLITLVPALAILLTAQDQPMPGPGPGYIPSGSPADLHDLVRLARLRDPRVRAMGFSSYDRKGGNYDGFNGTYSKLRVEDGNSVLAELDGPGVIQRIWTTHTSGEHAGLLDRKNEHIKIYLDGQAKPALDVPLETLFSGKHPHFPRPLVMEGSGGFVSYVPIPFRNGCKVVVEGQGVRFYQIGLVTLPSAEGVDTFVEQPSAPVLADLKAAKALWASPETYETQMLAKSLTAEYSVEGIARSEQVFGMPAGPATIQSIELEPSAGTADGWRSARLRMVWDQDASGEPGVDLPFDYAFGTLPDAIGFQSLLIGQRGGSWYNRFPMPYHRQASLRIDAEKPIKGKLRVRYRKGVDADAGYLRASYREALPTRPKEDFGWLKEEGRGHFAGVLMSTQGRAKLPYWLEGDDRFTIDGKLAIHGTGSEDFFNGGWYALEGRLNGPSAYPSHGFPIYRSPENEVWQAAAYRWNVADPVPFSISITAGIEHGGENQFEADYRAGVFWYSPNPSPTHRVP